MWLPAEVQSTVIVLVAAPLVIVPPPVGRFQPQLVTGVIQEYILLVVLLQTLCGPFIVGKTLLLTAIVRAGDGCPSPQLPLTP